MSVPATAACHGRLFQIAAIPPAPLMNLAATPDRAEVATR